MIPKTEIVETRPEFLSVYSKWMYFISTAPSVWMGWAELQQSGNIKSTTVEEAIVFIWLIV